MAGWSEEGLDRAVALPGTRNGPATLVPETIKRHLQLSKGFGNVLVYNDSGTISFQTF